MQLVFTGIKMTEYEILSLAHRTCWRYKDAGPTFTFDEKTLLEFVRLLKVMEKPVGSA